MFVMTKTALLQARHSPGSHVHYEADEHSIGIGIAAHGRPLLLKASAVGDLNAGELGRVPVH